MALPVGLKHNKIILGALSSASQFKGLRHLFSMVTSNLTKGRIKSFDDINKIEGINKAVQQLTLSERNTYRKILVPIGFPEIVVQQGKITGLISVRRISTGLRVTDTLVDTKSFQKKVVNNLKQHIDYLQKESFFQKAHKQAKQMGIIERNEITRAWYHNYALEQGVNYRSLQMLQEGGRRTSDMRLGRMYFFRYTPDNPEEIYDEYPLLFLLYEDADNFSGINFHHLSPKLRAILLGNMLMYLTNQDYTNRTRLFARKFRDVIGNNKRFRHAKVSYRQYRSNQIKSKVIQVHPLDWELAIMVPTERFKTIGGSRTSSKKIWYKTAKRARSLK